MTRDSRLLACAALSAAAHLALAMSMRHLPKRSEAARRVISLRVVSPPPAAEPPPEPALTPAVSPQKPAVVAHLRSRVRTPPTVVPEPVEKAVPPADHQEPPVGGSVGGPVFGISIESTSAAGSGPAMSVGHTSGGLKPGAGDDDGPDRSRGVTTVVPAYAVTAMPMPLGRCEGKYTPEALRAAIEGMVILDVIVGDTGRVREVRVVSGLGEGLTGAALSAIKGCRFSPGEKDGKPVAVRIPGYKIRFLLPSDE
jgi:periplasmic protein TonB